MLSALPQSQTAATGRAGTLPCPRKANRMPSSPACTLTPWPVRSRSASASARPHGRFTRAPNRECTTKCGRPSRRRSAPRRSSRSEATAPPVTNCWATDSRMCQAEFSSTANSPCSHPSSAATATERSSDREGPARVAPRAPQILGGWGATPRTFVASWRENFWSGKESGVSRKGARPLREPVAFSVCALASLRWREIRTCLLLRAGSDVDDGSLPEFGQPTAVMPATASAQQPDGERRRW